MVEGIAPAFTFHFALFLQAHPTGGFAPWILTVPPVLGRPDPKVEMEVPLGKWFSTLAVAVRITWENF